VGKLEAEIPQLSYPRALRARLVPTGSALAAVPLLVTLTLAHPSHVCLPTRTRLPDLRVQPRTHIQTHYKHGCTSTGTQVREHPLARAHTRTQRMKAFACARGHTHTHTRSLARAHTLNDTRTRTHTRLMSEDVRTGAGNGAVDEAFGLLPLLGSQAVCLQSPSAAGLCVRVRTHAGVRECV